jgi:deoxyribose-phosphate aldolase
MTSGIDVIIDYYNLLSNKKTTRESLLKDIKRGKKELLCSKLINEFYEIEKKHKDKKVLLSIIDTKLLLKNI